MTTLELYRQLRAGQVSKDKFIYEVRKDSRIPWVTNVTSYEDSIKILKNKGIISEAYSAPQKGIYDPVELDLQQHREYEDTYEDAIDMAAKENGMDPEELKSLYSRADALGENPIDLNEYDENEHPSLSYFTPDEDTAYKLINLLPDWLQTELNGNAVDLIGISTRQMPSYLKRMNKFVTANMPEIAQTLIDLNSPEKRQQRLSAYKKNNKNYTNVTSLSEMDINDPILMQIRANAQKKSLPKPSAPNNKEFQKAQEIRRLQKKLAQLMRDQDFEAGHFGSEWDDDMANDYADTKLNPIQQQIDKLRGPEKNVYMSKAEIDRRSAMMNESHKLTTSQIIDRLSPYDFKIGLEFELNKEKDLRSVDLDKIKERVAKKLQKNPKAYRDTKHPDSKKAIKNDEKSKMVDVKEKNLKDKGNEMTKAKGQTVKANTKSSKAENKKGKPAGVKEMKPSNKTPKGVKKMEVPGKEKILESMIIEMLKKKDKLKENYETPVKRDDYKIGNKVVTPEGHGTIVDVHGSQVFVRLAIQKPQEEPRAFTFNVLDHQRDYSKGEERQAWDNWKGTPFGGMVGTPERINEKTQKLLSKIKEYLSKKKDKKSLKKEEVVDITDPQSKAKTTVITPNQAATAALTRLGGKAVPNTKGVIKIGQSTQKG